MGTEHSATVTKKVQQGFAMIPKSRTHMPPLGSEKKMLAEDALTGFH